MRYAQGDRFALACAEDAISRQSAHENHGLAVEVEERFRVWEFLRLVEHIQ